MSYNENSVAKLKDLVSLATKTKAAITAAVADLPVEMFLDQAKTTFVGNFAFDATTYAGATNPNLDGKAVMVLGVKTRSNDGVTTTTAYSFIDVSYLVDTYTASDTSVVVSGYKLKANVSTETGNMLATTANGLYVDGSGKVGKEKAPKLYIFLLPSFLLTEIKAKSPPKVIPKRALSTV